MRKRTRLREKLTYANVMATLGVFIALGGVSYASLKLPKNSVGSKQIKKAAVTTPKIKQNAVTGLKVKDHSLTGKDIDLTELGTVPSATHASSADSLSSPEPIHLVGAPGEPSFQEGSANATLPPSEPVKLPPVGFYKDHDGIVHLEGFAKVGGATNLIFQLPPGFRPAPGVTLSYEQLGKHVSVFGSGISFAGRDWAGAVYAEAGAEVSLSGITFRAQS